jgi:TetR/AcrR family transcriptional repressor of bet genes
VPRLVDHEVRHHEITSAVRRVIVRDGLHGVTFQAVGVEAGVSVRLIQYYFGTKDEFLLATYRSVLVDVGGRFELGSTETTGGNSPYELISRALLELLPLDDVRREEAIVLVAFGAAAITSGGLGREVSTTAPAALVHKIVGLLERVRPGQNHLERTRLDAELLVAATGGIAQGMLLGQHSEQMAVALLNHLLDRVLNLD